MAQKTIHDIATSAPFTSVTGTEELILWKDSATKGGLLSVIRDWIIGAIPDASGLHKGLMSSADFTKVQNLSTVASTGAYSDLTGVPTFADVATSGDYADLTGAPVEATDVDTGLMSALDKAKLDGIEDGANNYVLPAAGAEIGGILRGAAVADAVDETEVVAQFNALLAELRTAGVLAT